MLQVRTGKFFKHEAYKQRVARSGEGKSGVFRTIIAYRSGRRAFFVFGLAKNNRDNLGTGDERDLKDFSGPGE